MNNCDFMCRRFHRHQLKNIILSTNLSVLRTPSNINDGAFCENS